MLSRELIFILEYMARTERLIAEPAGTGTRIWARRGRKRWIVAETAGRHRGLTDEPGLRLVKFKKWVSATILYHYSLKFHVVIF